jgi:predicted  nucleic acid-binding Zn-ribbon protein
MNYQCGGTKVRCTQCEQARQKCNRTDLFKRDMIMSAMPMLTEEVLDRLIALEDGDEGDEAEEEREPEGVREVGSAKKGKRGKGSRANRKKAIVVDNLDTDDANEEEEEEALEAGRKLSRKKAKHVAVSTPSPQKTGLKLVLKPAIRTPTDNTSPAQPLFLPTGSPTPAESPIPFGSPMLLHPDSPPLRPSPPPILAPIHDFMDDFTDSDSSDSLIAKSRPPTPALSFPDLNNETISYMLGALHRIKISKEFESSERFLPLEIIARQQALKLHNTNLHTAVTELQAAFAEAKSQGEDVRRELAEAVAELASWKNAADGGSPQIQLETMMQELAKTREGFTNTFANMERELGETCTALAAAQTEAHAGTRRELIAANKIIDDLEEGLANANRDLDATHKKNFDLESDLVNAQRDLDATRSQIVDLEGELVNARHDLNDANNTISELQDSIDNHHDPTVFELQIDLEDTRHTLATTIQEQENRINSVRRELTAAQYLMQSWKARAEKQELRNIHRVIDLEQIVTDTKGVPATSEGLSYIGRRLDALLKKDQEDAE